jgi:hypothetical protein
MAESVIGSKEVAIAIITFVLANLGQLTGVEFPLTPDQIYGAGIALMLMARIFWTSGKIQSILPK